MSFLSSCGDRCGWIAASLAAVAWGSFGVPIKYTSSTSTSSSSSSAACSIDVDVSPLVMQSYKTLVCFVTSFGFVMLLGERLQWSHWGLASGLFWVPGATCGVYGIRHAGLAVAVGTWSSLNVLTSFYFGIVVFRESVKDAFAACCAFLLLVSGLIGMARFSSSSSSDSFTTSSSSSASTSTSCTTESSVTLSSLSAASALQRHQQGSHIGIMEMESLTRHAFVDDEDLIMGSSANGVSINSVDFNKQNADKEQKIILLGGGRRFFSFFSLTQRQLGILGAAVNGSWGGMNLVPLHYAKQRNGLSGAAYVVSFAGGAMIVNAAMWIVLFLYYYWWQTNKQQQQQRRSWRDALECLPKWHLKQLGCRGLLAGILYSIGNFSSIVAVSLLGQAAGYSACQMQLLVSGLWGVFFFQEIKSPKAIAKWFLSAGTALLGIIWLSYLHEGGGGGGGGAESLH